MKKNPTPLTLVKPEDALREDDVFKDPETGCFDGAHEVKKLDCSFYNECLDVAIAGKWKGFGCTDCTAYVAIDIEQKMQDLLGLLAADMAAENVAKMGKANRTRGVKPGVDARVPGRGNCKVRKKKSG